MGSSPTLRSVQFLRNDRLVPGRNHIDGRHKPLGRCERPRAENTALGSPGSDDLRFYPRWCIRDVSLVGNRFRIHRLHWYCECLQLYGWHQRHHGTIQYRGAGISPICKPVVR